MSTAHKTVPISFEFFPPNTPVGDQKLKDVVQQLGALQPEFFSVTYGAGGSTRDKTLNTVRAIAEAGYKNPRPIQAESIQPILDGCDILGLAQTGTGKTAAFVLPILHRLLKGGRPGIFPRVLVISPTRELTNQIHGEVEALGKYTGVKSMTVFGGVGVNPQMRALRNKPDVVVACPGRLLDLISRGSVRLSGVEVLVLDEADHMFDMGFLPDVRKVISYLPKRRQNLLFSATMPKEIRHLTKEVLTDPVVVELNHQAPVETIEHKLYPVHPTRKGDLLQRMVCEEDFRSAIVFTGPDTNRDIIVRYIQTKGTIDPSADSNWSFVPMPGTSIVFESGSRGREHLADMKGVKIEEVGPGESGFTRYRIAL